MKTKITILLLSGLLFSCNSWLDVDAEDRILERELFKTREGFLTALNGVYSELNASSLYGRNLTVGLIDAMAQYYDISAENSPFYYYRTYDYADARYKEAFSGIWTKTYDMIANCNTIIEHCGDGNPLLSDTYYGIIKGEATALRAMLHFDLLRMFGPVWADDDGTTTYIPYMTEADRKVQPLLTAGTFMGKVLGDFADAAGLLAATDPVLTEGANIPDGTVSSPDMYYRQFRLNYYAVQALRARALLWSGDGAEAGRIAREVIAAVTTGDSPLFPLADNQHMVKYPNDLIFSPEVLFSLYNTSRETMVYNYYFGPNNKIGWRLTFPGTFTEGRITNFYDDKNDHRYKMWSEGVVDGNTFVYLTKYTNRNIKDRKYIDYMIPLIRMSEIYLIAAECEDYHEVAAEKYMNPLRLSRNCINITATSPEELASAIKDEYMREFIGEGQLFFYFKRRGLMNIPDGQRASGDIEFLKENYIFPLPDSEISQRQNQTQNE